MLAARDYEQQRARGTRHPRTRTKRLIALRADLVHPDVVSVRIYVILEDERAFDLAELGVADALEDELPVVGEEVGGKGARLDDAGELVSTVRVKLGEAVPVAGMRVRRILVRACVRWESKKAMSALRVRLPRMS